MAGSDPYRAAQLRARELAGSLSASAARDIADALKKYSTELAGRLAALPSTSPAERRAALEASQRIVQAARVDLERTLAASIAGNRLVSFEEVQRIWQEAGIAAARTAGVSTALLGGIHTPPLSLMGAYENLGGGARTWKTALTQYAKGGADEIDRIVREGIQNGLSTAELARRLRPYVQGAEEFHQAFGGAAFERLRNMQGHLPAEMRNAAKKVRYNSWRIAESEILNARAEAELQHYAVDPLIDGIIWTLSPDRGSTRTPDICNVLAENVWYEGRPRGWFPLNRVPLPPHPHDRCGRRPSVRAARDAGTPKPHPSRTLAPDAVSVAGDVGEARLASLREEAATLLAHTDSHRAQQALLQLMQSGDAAGAELARTRQAASRVHLQLPPGIAPPPTTAEAIAADVQSLVPGATSTPVELRSAEAVAREGAGWFDVGARVAHVSPDVTRELERLAAGEATPASIDAVRTVAQELWHSASPMLRGGRAEYVNLPAAGKFWEEGIADHRARQLVAQRYFGTTLDRVPAEVSAVWTSRGREAAMAAWVAEHVGESALATIWAERTAKDRAAAVSAIVLQLVEPEIARFDLEASVAAKLRLLLRAAGWKALFLDGAETVLGRPLLERILTANSRDEFLAAVYLAAGQQR